MSSGIVICPILALAILLILKATHGFNLADLAQGGSVDVNDLIQKSSLTAEERDNKLIPQEHACSVCTVVASTIYHGLAHKLRHDRDLPSKTIKELKKDLKDICVAEKFDRYGIKLLNGKKVLSGPALGAFREPGVVVGLGTWRDRLQARCKKTLKVRGAKVLVSSFQELSGLAGFNDYLCKGICQPFNHRMAKYTSSSRPQTRESSDVDVLQPDDYDLVPVTEEELAEMWAKEEAAREEAEALKGNSPNANNHQEL